MKKVILSLALLAFSAVSLAQVGIGTTTPNSSSVLDVVSTDKGFLMPRMTTVQRTGITTSATTVGLQVYDTVTKSVWYHDGTLWIEVGTATGGDTSKDTWVDNGAGTSVSTLGKVGIGTTTPGTMIDVVTSEEVIARFKSTNAYPSIHISSDGTDQHPLLSFRNGTTQVGAIGVDEQKDILTFGRASINDDFMVIDSDGNVGIGTTTPAAKLHVHHATYNTVSRFESGDAGVNITFKDDTSSNRAIVGATADRLYLGHITGGEQLVVLPNGNVGIGTTAPAAKLHIEGANSILLNHGNYVSKGIVHNGHNLALQTNGTNRVVIPNMSGSLSQILLSDGQVNYPSFSFIDDRNTGVYSPADNTLAITTNGSEAVRVLANGNVGIGTTNPLEKLHVNGKIRTATSIYADYVFEEYYNGYSDIKEDYSFKSLAEVDNFIKAYKHLPGITSIKDIPKTEEGLYSINITDLSVQLLEKVEELYLHTIEQEKEISNQKKEIQKIVLEKDKQISNLSKRLEKLEKLLN